jgi:hypothetical protein
MINNISFIQLLILFLINLPGLFLIVLIFIVIKKSGFNEKKLFTSLFISAISISLFFIVLLDVGISLWISSKNINSIISVIPIYFCSSPLLFIFVMIGTYIQLIYSEVFYDWVYGISKNG